jgi:preprotein translocase SecE subunit
MLLLALFGSFRLFQLTVTPDSVAVLGMNVPVAALWSAGLFVALGGVILLLSVGPTTGIEGIDSKTHQLIDLLIDTETELGKVSWPDSEELTRSTTAVLVCIVLFGAFLFVVDWGVTLVMRAIEVLPG